MQLSRVSVLLGYSLLGCQQLSDLEAKAIGHLTGKDLPSLGDRSKLALSILDDPTEWENMEGVVSQGVGSLASLNTFERDLAFVHHYYVDSNQLRDERLSEMLKFSLQYVEQNVDEVQFIVRDNEIVGNVGTRSRTFSTEPLQNLDDLLQTVQPIAAFLDSALPEDVDRPTVEYLLLNGALSALDPHSILLPPVEAAEMETDNQGEFGGLGIEISLQEGQLVVKQPIEGTPAWEAGLKSDDKIVRIENTSTINMDLEEAVSLLRGKVGEPVTIMVMRTGWNAPKPYTIVRGRIKIDPVKGELLDGKIAYIKIQSFHKNVAEDMNSYLKELEQRSGGLKGLVLDLRNNPGGFLNQAIKVSDRFIRNGVIVATVEGAERTREESQAHSAQTISDIPIAVLVNGHSASASEIVAGALRNQGRAIIIGERTFGKGSVQHLYGNPDESRLKLTVAQYLTPGDQSIQSVGIPPDVLLQPSLIRAEAGETEEMVSLYWRDWITREGDLDRHLNNDSTLEGQTRFSLRYLYEEKEGKDRTDPNKDWEVLFAKKVLERTEGVDRTSALIAAKTVVEQVEAEEQRKIQNAFAGLGLDWTSGVNHYQKSGEDLQVSIQFGEDNALLAGEDERIQVHVQNKSERSYHQVSLLLKSEHPSLDHREVYFGKIGPNEQLNREIEVTVPTGYGNETIDYDVELRDASQTLLEQTAMVQTIARDLPKFSWTLEFFDGQDGKGKGNGNGLAEVGEEVEVEITLTNTGKGEGVEPYARLKNRARKQIDLMVGTVEFGEEPSCEECERTLPPSMSATGNMRFLIKEKPEQGDWDLELIVGTNRSYDYNTIVQGGFSEYFQLKTPLTISSTETLSVMTYDQPLITIEHQSVSGDRLELSGFVEDESGVTDILVFNNTEKVYYKGETGLSGKIPFTTDVQLGEGSNPVYILTKDNQGLHNSTFIQVWQKQ